MRWKISQMAKINIIKGSCLWAEQHTVRRSFIFKGAKDRGGRSNAEKNVENVEKNLELPKVDTWETPLIPTWFRFRKPGARFTNYQIERMDTGEAFFGLNQRPNSRQNVDTGVWFPFFLYIYIIRKIFGVFVN